MTNEATSQPSYQPASTTSFEGVISEILKKFGAGFEVCLPAIVVSYSRNTNIVTVQPAIDIVTTLGDKVERSYIKVPAHTYAGGGYFMNFPLSAGDTGFILACDRDISIFKQNLKRSNPNTNRKHCFEDSFFIPDKVRNFTISGDDAGALVISSLNGLSKIVLHQDKVVITSPQVIVNASTDVEINTPKAVFSGIVQMPYPQFGNTPTAIGGGRASVDYDTTGAVRSGSITLATHVHSGVLSGGSNTGEPV